MISVDEFLADEKPSKMKSVDEFLTEKKTMIPKPTQVTQPFGNYDPELEKYSGGKNLGVDLRAQENTPLSVPEGEWEVVKSVPGFNSGSGNFVKIRNTVTGDTLGFEHLNKIDVTEGQKLLGGDLVGLSGGGQSDAGRGNSTAPHISIPYQNAQGEYQDILESPYKDYLPVIQ